MNVSGHVESMKSGKMENVIAIMDLLSLMELVENAPSILCFLIQFVSVIRDINGTQKHLVVISFVEKMKSGKMENVSAILDWLDLEEFANNAQLTLLSQMKIVSVIKDINGTKIN